MALGADHGTAVTKRNGINCGRLRKFLGKNDPKPYNMGS